MGTDISLAAQTQWVGEVKDELRKLNDLPASIPDGIDVKVTTARVNAQVGGITECSGANQVWKVSVGAKTDALT
ncbi:hypothetical protein P3T24_006349 [Paraburkholderia sp. GAS33]|uniref:hypothetical protein n=1 Tax=Paraburkholderia sp. GAS33 TaxID=3035130 RepID=UPI003D21A0AC